MLIVVGLCGLAFGDYPMSPFDALRALLGQADAGTTYIVESLRLPRVLLGALVGAALGVGGAIFQSVSRNPLGSPDVIGFDTGAATGALLVITIAHGSGATISLAAVGGGVATALVVYLVGMRHGAAGYRLILIGIGIAAMLTAFNTYLIAEATQSEARRSTVWLTGSLADASTSDVRNVAVALAVLLPIALGMSRVLTTLEMGDDIASALGIRVERTRLALIVVGVSVAAVGTAAAGPVTFVALAAPQIARRVIDRSSPCVGGAALTGAVLLVASDIAAQRVFAPNQLPVGVVTGVVGGVFLAWLLVSQWRGSHG